MKAVKLILIALVALVAMDAIYVGYSQSTAGSNAYATQSDLSTDE